MTGERKMKKSIAVRSIGAHRPKQRRGSRSMLRTIVPRGAIRRPDMRTETRGWAWRVLEMTIGRLALVFFVLGAITYGSTTVCFAFFGISAGLFLLLLALDVSRR